MNKGLDCRSGLVTIVALRAIEAVGTLADVGPHAGASVQTDRQAKSLETQRSERSESLQSEGVSVPTGSLTGLARRSSPARWTQAFVRRHAPAPVVTVTAAHHCQRSENQRINII